METKILGRPKYIIDNQIEWDNFSIVKTSDNLWTTKCGKFIVTKYIKKRGQHILTFEPIKKICSNCRCEYILDDLFKKENCYIYNSVDLRTRRHYKYNLHTIETYKLHDNFCLAPKLNKLDIRKVLNSRLYDYLYDYISKIIGFKIIPERTYNYDYLCRSCAKDLIKNGSLCIYVRHFDTYTIMSYDIIDYKFANGTRHPYFNYSREKIDKLRKDIYKML